MSFKITKEIEEAVAKINKKLDNNISLNENELATLALIYLIEEESS